MIGAYARYSIRNCLGETMGGGLVGLRDVSWGWCIFRCARIGGDIWYYISLGRGLGGRCWWKIVPREHIYLCLARILEVGEWILLLRRVGGEGARTSRSGRGGKKKGKKLFVIGAARNRTGAGTATT